MKRDKLKEQARDLRELAGAIVAFVDSGAVTEYPRIRECAKRAARIAAHVAALARGRERSRCAHDFPDPATLARSGWHACGRCKLARHIKSTNPESMDRVLCDRCTCYHARKDACPEAISTTRSS